MKFKYLTKAEFDALSEYGKEKYTAEKREAEKQEVEVAAGEKAKEIAEGIVEGVKTELNKTIADQAVEISTLKTGLSESEKKVEAALADIKRISLKEKGKEVKTMQNEIYEALSNPESDAHKQMVAYTKDKTPINFTIDGRAKAAGTIPYVAGTSASQWVSPVGIPHEVVQARDVIPVFNTTANSITYVQFTKGQGKIASVNAGASKPQFDYISTPKVTPIVKIAGYVTVQEEFLDDVVGAPEWLAQELPWAYKDEETRQVFFGLGNTVGGGVAPELNGLYSEVATAVNYTNTSVDPTTSNDWDRLAVALTNTRRSLRPADAIWLSPEDYMELLINKSTGATQIYDYPIQANTTGQLYIGNIPIYFHTVFAQGQGIAGNFQRGVALFQRMGITLRTSTETGNNFIQNLVTFLIEARVGMPVYFPESFKKIDLTITT